MNVEINPIIIEILNRRGIIGERAVEEYLSPVPKETHDPFLMKGMREAVDLVLEHIDRGSRICIYGDYDADGVTSVTLLKEYLGYFSENITSYIPSRFEEGYGLNMTAAERIAEAGTDLVITVDCGCVSQKEVAYMKQLGMDVLVTDHHEVDDRKPDCIMLDPKQDGETYPYRHLCGCGVAFKLAQAIGRSRGVPKNILNHTLDLAGIATIADVVPLTGENRTLVKYGFDRIRKQERPGLVTLMEEIGLQPQKLSSYNISFGIAPHINSAGRMSTAATAVELLSAPGREEAAICAQELVRLNNERRRLQDEIYENAVQEIESKPLPPIIVHNAGAAHEGVTGIVAGKLKERYSRPVILLAEAAEPGYFKGTGRSVQRVSIIELIRENAALMSRFGGHAAACGFTLPEENISALEQNLTESLQNRLQLDPGLLDERRQADAVISGEDVDLSLAQQIQWMEPFGAGNEMPLFEVRGLLVRYVRSMGRNAQYRRYVCESGSGKRIEAVLFDDSVKNRDEIFSGCQVTFLAELSVNEWQGRSSVQLIVRDITEIVQP